MSVAIEKIVENKCYVGTLKTKSSPKTSKYWLGTENNVVILNPELIGSQLEAAKAKIAEARKSNKTILLISDKSLYREEIANLSAKMNFFYLNYKVPAGVLTNFETLLLRIKSMNELKYYIESDEFEHLTKKEKSAKLRQLKKVELLYKGVKNLTKRPDLVLVLDGKFMAKFVDELEKLHIDNIVLASSDFNRWWKEENLIISNVSYFESVDFILNYILSK